MTEQVPRIFTAFQCPICGLSKPNWNSSFASAHLFDSPGELTCVGCRTSFPLRNGYLDLHSGEPENIVPFQQLMQSTFAVSVYEALWRPIGYFIASKHSFPKDADRIASFIQHRKGVICDLACGPGNLTRRIARLLPEATVIGFDLSHQMLERAVRLTRKERLQNVYYMRGSVLSMPFKAEAFDAISCCGALQLFQNQDQAWAEIARVLRIQGDLVCQTTIGPRKPPLYVSVTNRLLKFGYFYLDDLKDRLYQHNFDLQDEERSNINYIFRAAKSG